MRRKNSPDEKIMRVRPGDLRTTSASLPEAGGHISIPLYLCRVPAGFPSPAGDYVESNIDFNEWLVRNEPSTFVVQVEGDSMEGLIHHGDRLVVDRSLDARHRDVVVAKLDGGLTVKRLLLEGGRVVLAAENPAYPSVEVGGEEGLTVWGVATYCIRRLR